jgi:integrase
MPAAARKVALTDRSLQALRPAQEGQRAIVWDALLPGMAVRVSVKGKRSFYAVKRRAGHTQPSWVLLGAYPVVTLAEARAKARETLGALMEGLHPASLAEAKRRAAEEAERQFKANTFAAVAEDFIRRHAMTKRSGRMVAGIIRRELIPAWGERQITEITRRDVIALVEAILDRGGDRPLAGTRRRTGGPYAARHALSATRKLFNWAIGRDLLTVSPCDRIKAAELHGPPEARDRVLMDDEIRRVWAAAEATPYPYGPLVRLLMLTGQRRDEIAGARWGEVDLDRVILTIGAGRMKAGVGHAVPLTPAAVEILRALPRWATGDYVFAGRTGAKPFSGFSKAKARLDRAIGDIKSYSLHDLRRTVRTRLAELGVTPFVGELVIGHAQKGVHGIYDLHTYGVEKREALLRWEERLFAIVAEAGTGQRRHSAGEGASVTERDPASGSASRCTWPTGC